MKNVTGTAAPTAGQNLPDLLDYEAVANLFAYLSVEVPRDPANIGRLEEMREER